MTMPISIMKIQPDHILLPIFTISILTGTIPGIGILGMQIPGTGVQDVVYMSVFPMVCGIPIGIRGAGMVDAAIHMYQHIQGTILITGITIILLFTPTHPRIIKKDHGTGVQVSRFGKSPGQVVELMLILLPEEQVMTALGFENPDM